MRRLLLIGFFVVEVLTSDAQRLTPAYVDSVKRFFNSSAFAELLQTRHTGTNIHPAIVLHPISKPEATHEQIRSVMEGFNKGWTVIYHWAPKARPSLGDTILYVADSIVLTESEKKEVLNSLTSQTVSAFKWTNDFFPGAIFPLQPQDSIFQKSVNFPNGVYAFSMPVFLRDYTYCIVLYCWILDGNAGHQSYHVYKKIDGSRWWKFGEFGGGDW